MAELWRNLKVGDRVRILAWPKEYPPDRLHPESREFLTWVINSQVILKVVEIDAWGIPYGKVVRWVDGKETFEYWGLDHGALEIVW